MRITVYNSDGGVGKTPIALNIVFEKEFALGTNETFHLNDTLLPDEQLIAIELEDEFPEYPPEVDVVFDLAGSISRSAHSITSALLQSDLVIVPTYFEDPAIAKTIGTLEAITSLEDFNAPILVVVTKLEKGRKESFNSKDPKAWVKSEQFQYVKDRLRKEGLLFPMLPLKKSAVFDRLFTKALSIQQMRERDGLLRASYKDVSAQFDLIFNYIEENSNGKQQSDSVQAA